MGVIHFAQQFAATIEIVGIGKVGFPVITLLTGKHAICADVHQTGAGCSAQSRQAMRQQRIQRNRLQRIVGIGQLLDETHAIHHQFRPHLGKCANYGIGLFDINTANDVIPQRPLKMSPRRIAPGGAMHGKG